MVIEDTIRPGDLVKNPFRGEFPLSNRPQGGETATVHSGSLGLVLAVSGSHVYVLVEGRLGWAPFGMFDRVL